MSPRRKNDPAPTDQENLINESDESEIESAERSAATGPDDQPGPDDDDDPDNDGIAEGAEEGMDERHPEDGESDTGRVDSDRDLNSDGVDNSGREGENAEAENAEKPITYRVLERCQLSTDPNGPVEWYDENTKVELTPTRAREYTDRGVRLSRIPKHEMARTASVG